MILTLIGSGEFSELFLNLYESLIDRLPARRVTFLDTPAGFQLNADEISAAAAAYFKRHFNLDLAIASYRRASADPAPAVAQLRETDCLIAGPGSPTYAINLWRNTPVWQAVLDRWQAGAQLVFASSAAIALGRLALPVYEIYKAGSDPFWAEGLNLLGPLGYDLAILPHYNNTEGRTYDTRYCFVGEPRLLALEKLLSPATVILGLDENTAAILDFDSQTITVAGAGRLTLRYRGQEVGYPAGSTLPMDRLAPANALTYRLLAEAPSRPTAHTTLPTPPAVPSLLLEWAAERSRLRADKKFAESDRLRDRIAAAGYAVKDSPSGPVLTLTRYANPGAAPSRVAEPDACAWSVCLLAHNNQADILRAARGALAWGGERPIEVVIVDNGSDDGTAEAVAGLAAEDERVKPVFLAADVGEGAGRNAGLRASRGTHVMLLGGHMEITGDVFGPLAQALADPAVGAAGSNGLVSADLFSFNPAPTSEADALEFYVFAFRRERLGTVGLLDEKFVFYRNLDLDWSLAFKDRGLRLVSAPGLPLAVHEHPYLRMDPAERDRLSKKNYRRFLEKWRDRKDLLVGNP